MNPRYIYILLGLVIVGAGATFFFVGKENPSEVHTEVIDGGSVVTNGSYNIVSAESIVNWSGKKPLIEGYVNSGTIGISTGNILVLDSTASGSFIIDMNTVKVGLTAAKPGKEGALEGHLKGENFFNVAKFPTSNFVITKVSKRADSDTTLTYDVTGNLTMKGVTNEITFPATIYMKDGKLHAKASTEINRTKWGITVGSGSFFDNLANNVIDDMVALSFHLVATQSN